MNTRSRGILDSAHFRQPFSLGRNKIFAFVVFAIITTGLSVYCLIYEGSLFTFGATFAMIASLAVLTGQLLTPTLTTAIVVSIIVAISAVKFSFLDTFFIVPDLILVSNLDMLEYLWAYPTSYMIALTLALLTLISLVALGIVKDSTRINRRLGRDLSSFLFVCRRHGSATVDIRLRGDWYFISFYVSIWHVAKLMFPHPPLFELADVPDFRGIFRFQESCDTDQTRPHIVLD